jgi:hypothetical protein
LLEVKTAVLAVMDILPFVGISYVKVVASN